MSVCEGSDNEDLMDSDSVNSEEFLPGAGSKDAHTHSKSQGILVISLR